MQRRTLKATVTVALAAAAALVVVPPGAAAAGPAPAGGPTVTWTPCPEDPTADCGTIRVPIDWTRPAGGSVDLALARRKATDPAHRIGSLIVNPGGPGGSGVDFVVSGAAYFSSTLRSRFDLVGFDPRGAPRGGGPRHPVLCSAATSALEPSPVFTGQADFDADKAANRKIYDDCRSHTGPLIDHVDSVSVARDIDAIRAAVGDRKLTFYGVSYGTLMGQMYAELYPDRIRAVTIDSNMDHSLGTAGFLLTEAATVQDSFDEFVKGCGADPGCVLHGTDIKALWASLLARAARGELHDPGAPDVAITPDLLIQFATGAFYGPTWRDLAATLQQLDAAATAAGPVAYDESLVGNSLQPQFCGDWSLPVRGYAEYAQLMKAQNLVAPDMRYSPVALTATAACLGWPAPVQNPQHALRVTHPSATLLELNNVHDPATAYAWALDAKLQLGPAARLLTYEGWGHGSYGRSACVTGAVDAYLVDGTLPAAGTHCAAVPPDAAAFAPHASSLPKGRF